MLNKKDESSPNKSNNNDKNGPTTTVIASMTTTTKTIKAGIRFKNSLYKKKAQGNNQSTTTRAEEISEEKSIETAGSRFYPSSQDINKLEKQESRS